MARITIPDQPAHKLLRYTTDENSLHQAVITRLKSRLKMAQEAMSNRYPEWDRVDEQVRLFMNLTDGARAGDKTPIYNIDGSIKAEMPFTRSIVIPVSYVILSVRLSQLLSIVMAQKPMWPLEGTGPEDIEPSRLMEACLDYDMQQCRGLLSLFQFFQDAEKYGMGVVYDTWTDQYGWKMQQAAANPMARQFFQAVGMSPSDFKTWDIVKEYNNWESVDPFNFWPDPRVSRANLQQGEFCGHRFERSYLWLKERTVEKGGPYFNVDKLATLKSSKESNSNYRPRRDDLLAGVPPDSSTTDPDDKGYYTMDHLQVKIIPRDWKLGPGEDPEIWWFTLANESMIVRAHNSVYDHEQFTYGVGESNPDLHAPFNAGNIENVEPIQRFMNWLLNSHFENIRKHLNDMLIYGPSFVEEEDVLNPGPARHVRLSQRGEELVEMGADASRLIHQLQVGDVTTPHLQASQYLWEMVTRMFATEDPSMGHPTDEKKTLGEIQNIISGSSKRITVSYRLYEIMALQPLVLRAIANRQQFTSLEQYVQLVGDYAQEVFAANNGRLLVTPWDVQGQMDFAPRSNILPPDPAKSAIAWSQILFGMGKFPQVWAPGPDGKILDPRLIFNEIARNMGIKHIQQFYRQIGPMDLMGMGVGPPPGAPPPGQGKTPQQQQHQPVNVKVMPDHQVQQEVKKGNMI
jgi:hypothetical protein